MNKNDFYYVRLLNAATGVLAVENACRQFVVLNHTDKVIKLGVGLVNTDMYDFIVKANGYYVSPALNFISLQYIIDSYAASGVNPVLYAYRYAKFTPMVSVLT